MTSSNLIRNTIEQYGLIYSDGNLTIKGCTILYNNVSLTFQSSYDTTITVINCTMTEDDVHKTTGNVNIDSWKPSSTFYNEISATFFNDLCIPVHPIPIFTEKYLNIYLPKYQEKRFLHA